MEIVLIAAMAKNRVIGLNNQIPWHIPGEQRRFRDLTWGHTLIMGRRTYESIGKSLPGRRNIVITRNPNYAAPGCEIAASLDHAYSLSKNEGIVYNIGGEQLYHLGIKDADKLILTVLDCNMDGDTFFPEFSDSQFQLICSEKVTAGKIPYTILTYRRIAEKEYDWHLYQSRYEINSLVIQKMKILGNSLT